MGRHQEQKGPGRGRSSGFKRSQAGSTGSGLGELCKEKRSRIRVSQAMTGVPLGEGCKGRLVWAGKGQVATRPLKDSGDLLSKGDWPLLRSRLADDGYLFLKGALKPKDILKAREYVLKALHAESPSSFVRESEPALALAADGATSIGLLGRQHIAAASPVRSVLEGPDLFNLMSQLLQDDDVVTTAFKWLRAVAPEEFTGVHTDRVFLGRGSPRLLTAWIPLGDCPVEQGAMMIVPGSHSRDDFSALRSSYGTSEVGKDGTKSGWLSDDGRCINKWIQKKSSDHTADVQQLCETASSSGSEGNAERISDSNNVQWHTSDFSVGDVVILSLDTLHMSAANKSRKIRISCDTRWLPAADKRDPRLIAWNSAPYPLPA